MSASGDKDTASGDRASNSTWVKFCQKAGRRRSKARYIRTHYFTKAIWLLRALQPGILLLSFLVFFAFAIFTPAQEVFAATAEQFVDDGFGNLARSVWALILVLSLTSVLLFLAQRDFARLSSRQHEDFAPRLFSQGTAPLAVLVAIVTTASPWIASFFGFRAAAAEFDRVGQALLEIRGDFSETSKIFTEIQNSAGKLSDYGAAAEALAVMMLSLGVVAVVVLNGLPLLWPRRRRAVRFRFARHVGWALITATALSYVFIPLYCPEIALKFVRSIDPAATGALAIFFTLALLIALAFLAERLRTSLVTAIALVVVAAAFAQSYDPRPPGDGQATAKAPENKQNDGADSAFEARTKATENNQEDGAASAFERRLSAWLNTNHPGHETREEPVPVYVLAARGGGAYAAVSTATVLARLEKFDPGEGGATGSTSAPSFHKHLFAAVGVSGGSVGLAIDRSLRNDAPDRSGSADKSQDKLAVDILTDGHIGAVLSMFGADLARKLWPWTPRDLNDAFTRARALEHSLGTAYCRRVFGRDGSLEECAGSETTVEGDKTKAQLFQDFDTVASGEGKPLLALTTTSSITGDRVAFSPVPLRSVGQGDFISFSEFISPLDENEIKKTSLLRAAVASARFPFVTPAFTVGSTTSPQINRFNFVDGGVADSTGAAAAFEIFQQLERLRKTGTNIDPQLVLIVDQQQRVEHVRVDDGSRHRDIGATVNAFFNMRSLLSRRSLKRVTRAFDRQKIRSRLHVFEFERESFNLPLGWRLSKTMARMLALQMSQPDYAQDYQRDRDRGRLHPTSDVILNNGCTMRQIQSQITGSGAEMPLACRCAGVGGAYCAP